MNNSIRFDEDGLVPAICMDAESGQVLMLAYMNQEALERTLASGEVHFWSRSRRSLWHKGATSGNFLHVREIRMDCDADALLLRVRADGPACHTGETSCFYRGLDESVLGPEMNLGRLQAIIRSRSEASEDESYTARLLKGPRDRVIQKVGEEAVEVLVAAARQGRERLVEETADLFYHVLVLLAGENIALQDVYDELSRRHR